MSYITIISIIVLAVCFVVGLIKGLVRALLRFASAVGACVLTITLTPYLAKAMYSSSFAQQRNFPAALYSGISAIAILLGSALVFGLITLIIHKFISKTPLSGVNRLLGGVFYLLIGFAVLILLGYVINILSDMSFMQPVVNDAEKDPFSNWLITNNLFNKFMEAIAKEGSVFQDFLNGFKSIAPKDMPSGDALPSGE